MFLPRHTSTAEAEPAEGCRDKKISQSLTPVKHLKRLLTSPECKPHLSKSVFGRWGGTPASVVMCQTLWATSWEKDPGLLL